MYVHSQKSQLFNYKPRQLFISSRYRDMCNSTSHAFQKIIILTICRSPCGKFKNFITHLYLILHTLHLPKVHFILRGNLNIDFLKDIGVVRQMNALLETYNLINTVTSTTRIGENSFTVIDLTAFLAPN